jgi:hypothetical protein
MVMNFKSLLLSVLVVAASAHARAATPVSKDLKFLKACSFGGLLESNQSLDALKISRVTQNSCDKKALAAFDKGYQPYQVAYASVVVSKAAYCDMMVSGKQKLPRPATALFERQWGQLQLGNKGKIKEIKARDLAALCF